MSACLVRWQGLSRIPGLCLPSCFLRWRDMFVGVMRYLGPDSFLCPVAGTLGFPRHLLDQAMAALTITLYVAAVSTCHSGFGCATLCSHPLVTRVMMGIWRAPPGPLSAWGLLKILRARVDPQFGLLSSACVKLLSLKHNYWALPCPTWLSTLTFYRPGSVCCSSPVSLSATHSLLPLYRPL